MTSAMQKARWVPIISEHMYCRCDIKLLSKDREYRGAVDSYLESGSETAIQDKIYSKTS